MTKTYGSYLSDRATYAHAARESQTLTQDTYTQIVSDMYIIPFNFDQPLSHAQRDQIELALRALDEAFAFRLSIPMDDKARMHLLGKANLEWVEKCLSYAKDKPDFLSRPMTTEEFELYFDTRSEIRDYLSRLVPFVQDLKDTMDYLGHLSMGYSLDYYDGAKAGIGWKRQGSKSIAENLSKRFAGQGPNGNPNSTPPPPPTGEVKAESEDVAPQEQLTRLAEGLAKELEKDPGENKNEESDKEGGKNDE